MAPKPINTHIVTPDVPRPAAGVNPNATRYGWCPFKDISLVNSDGTLYYYVQPEGSPYHRNLPKSQLIPFITFPITTYVDDPTVASTPKNPNPKRPEVVTKSALEGATEILHAHSTWGFTILNSLEGMDQERASRIFAVVQPFAYRLGEIVSELQFAGARIDADEDLQFVLEGEDAPYIVEALRSEAERGIARNLRDEMLAGAETALSFANETFEKTEQSMTTRFAGGKGKTGGDPLDRYLSEELGRELPRLVGKEKSAPEIADVGKKVDFLVDREISRSQQEEIDRLRRENEELRAGKSAEIQAPGEGGELPKPPANNKAKSKIIE